MFLWLLVLVTSKTRFRDFDMVWELPKVNTFYNVGKETEKFRNSFRDVSPMGPFVEKNLNFDIAILSRGFQHLLQLFVIILLVLISFACDTLLSYCVCVQRKNFCNCYYSFFSFSFLLPFFWRTGKCYYHIFVQLLL